MDNHALNQQLYHVLASLQNAEEAELFLQDLCTLKEIEYMAQRVESAKLLMDNMTYQEVFKRVNISSATLSRVSKCVKYNTGYTSVLTRFFSKKRSEEEK